MLIAEQREGTLTILKTMSHKVQLAEGLHQSGKLSKAARQRGIDALQDFQEELVKYPVDHFCAVGTNALRQASNADKLIQEANKLGFPINVISGEEEAFYIYQGIQAYLPMSSKPRLVFDIGGGSTEFAVGDDLYPDMVESLNLGCVTSRDFYSGEEISHKSLAFLRRKIHTLLDQNLNPSFYDVDWHEAYASSGTAKMLSNILRENGITDGTITLPGLFQVEEIAVELGSTFKLNKLQGLKSSRRNVFVTGLAILQSIMDHLGIDHLDYCDFALREGVLLGLVQQGHDFPLYTLEGPLACKIVP